MQAATVKDEDGRSCATFDSLQQRCRRHFTKDLNINSVFSDSEVESVRQQPVRVQMAVPPSEEELLKAMMKLKSGKGMWRVWGTSRIGEGYMCGVGDCVEMLVELVKDVWQ